MAEVVVERDVAAVYLGLLDPRPAAALEDVGGAGADRDVPVAAGAHHQRVPADRHVIGEPVAGVAVVGGQLGLAGGLGRT